MPGLNKLVDSVRSKYPGQYDDMDDATLTKKVLAKYPQYSDLAAPGIKSAGKAATPEELKPDRERDFSYRVGNRIQENLDYVSHISNIAAGVEKASPEEAASSRALVAPIGEKYVGKTASKVLGGIAAPFRMAAGQAKQYAEDPATLAGDVVFASPELSEMAEGGIRDRATPRGKTVPKVPETMEPEQARAIDKANRGYQDAKAQADRRAGLEQTSKKFVQQAHENIQQTYARGRSALDQRWGEFRKGMEGERLDPVEAFNTIEEAKSKYLKGSPSSLKVFNDLAQEIGIQAIDEKTGEIISPKNSPVDLPFDTARVHYSAIGDKLASGGLPGNVYQALKSVERGLDEQLGKAAERRGLGKDYSALKSEESQFRRDWTDSDSPLAKARGALDANLAEPRLLGRGNEYLTKQLARWKQYGADPNLPAAAKHYAEQVKALPKKALPEVKGLPEPKEAKTGKGTHPVARAARRVALKVSAGHLLGLPGYAGAGELDNMIENSIRKKNARAATVPPPPE